MLESASADSVAFVSKNVNRTILERAQQIPYTKQLMEQQLLLLGFVAWASDTDLLRRLTFARGTLEPASSNMCDESDGLDMSGHQCGKEALEFIVFEAALTHVIKQMPLWKQAMRRHYRHC